MAKETYLSWQKRPTYLFIMAKETYNFKAACECYALGEMNERKHMSMSMDNLLQKRPISMAKETYVNGDQTRTTVR